MPKIIRLFRADGSKRALCFPGSPGIISTKDTFRVVIDGIEMADSATSCIESSNGFWYSVQGTCNGTFDCPVQSVACYANGGAGGGSSLGGINIYYSASSTCVSLLPLNFGFFVTIWMGGSSPSFNIPAGKILIHVGNFSFDPPRTFTFFFEAVVNPEDFFDGATVNNRITAWGDYSAAAPFATYAPQTIALGKNGTCTITRICP